MDVTKEELQRAEVRTLAARRGGYVCSVRYDRRRKRVVARLSTGIELAFPVEHLEELAGAPGEDLAQIEISPTGLGLHWPQLDADIYVPSLLQGVFGSRSWMAAQMGAAGGKVRSAAKTVAARANGRKGGRPRRIANS